MIPIPYGGGMYWVTSTRAMTSKTAEQAVVGVISAPTSMPAILSSLRSPGARTIGKPATPAPQTVSPCSAGVQAGLHVPQLSRGMKSSVVLPKSCSAVFEVIALVDVTQYIPPPYGIGIIYSFHLAKQFAERFGISLECGAGLDVSGAVNLCTSVPGGGLGGITSDSAKICAGGFAACNVGLSHTKSALPGGGH